MVTFAFEDFVFDDVRYELAQAGSVLRVDTQVLELLAYLLKNPARLVTKEELIAEVWQGRALGDNVISVCVAKLRKALGGPSNRCITNVYGRGYRFLLSVHVLEQQPQAAKPSSPPPALPIAPGAGPFVGRSVALGRLHTALTRTSSGRGGTCALLGEAGIGKTRAAEVLESQALEAGFLVSWGRCHVFGDAPPLWPWLQVVRSCEPQLPGELVSQPFERLLRGDFGPEETESEPYEDARSGSSLELHAQNAWHKTLAWVSAVTKRMSESQPWLIVLEDVQWADAATLELLAHVIAEAPQQRLFLVLTARDAELPTDPRCRRALDYVLGHRDCERIELTRLHETDIEAYTSQVFGASDNALTKAVFAKSEGNPFFMVELLRPWIDGPTPAASELTLSGYALDIVRQALRRLDVRAREALSAAAVVGRAFDLGLLATVTERSGEVLIEILEDAMTSHVIVAARESHTHFVFGHDLIRHVLYEDLPSIARVRLHQRVADALEARQSAVSPAELAHHLLSALPSGNVEKAVAAAQRAAGTASRIGAYADSSAFLRRALEALRLRSQTDPALTCKLLYDLARCERAGGEPGFAAHFDEALQLALKHGYADVLFAAGQRMSGSPGTVAMPGVGPVLEAALAALPKTDQRRRAIVLAHLAWTPPYCQSAAKVETLLAEAEKLAEGSSGSTKRTVLRARLYFAGGPDDHEKAFGIVAQMEHMASLRGPMRRALWMLEPQLGRIVAQLQRGEFAQAQRALEAFGTAARELHHAELIWHYERMCVVLRMNAGEYEFARRRLAELKQEADRLQLHARKAVEATDWGELIRQTTDITPFAAQFARGLAADAADNPNVQASKIRTMVQLGMLDEARAALHALPVRDLPALPKSRDYLATLAHFAVASVATQGLGHAEVLYELLKPYSHFCVAALSFHCHGVVSHFLAILARALGDRERALVHFEHALADQERLGLQPQLVRSRFELASMLVESGDQRQREQGRGMLEQVQTTAAKLGMQPLRSAAAKLVASVEG
jgi:DNA-binding winged helix-turn-helix (wHTH) protein/tetratricopeptide (TPR) repeat protein